MYTILEEENRRSRENSLAQAMGNEVNHNMPKSSAVQKVLCASEGEMSLQESKDGNESQGGEGKLHEDNSAASGLDKDLSMSIVEESLISSPTMEAVGRPLNFRRQRRGAVTKDNFKDGWEAESSSSPSRTPLLAGNKTERRFSVITQLCRDHDTREKLSLAQAPLERSQSDNELHKLGQTIPSEPMGPPTPPSLGHQRKGSLPIHIQRAFPELASPMRPQSPLVLHEMRSTSPETSPTLSLHRRQEVTKGFPTAKNADYSEALSRRIHRTSPDMEEKSLTSSDSHASLKREGLQAELARAEEFPRALPEKQREMKKAMTIDTSTPTIGKRR